MQGEKITEAVPESAEETAEKADLSTLVDISILSCNVPYAFTNFWGEPCMGVCLIRVYEGMVCVSLGCMGG